jgi:multiple sugar transport system ATP-binding protein
VVLGIRPSDLVLAAEGPSLPRLVAAIDHVENLGAHLHASFAVDAEPVEVDIVGDDEAAPALDQGEGSRWSVELADGTAVGAGTSLELALRVDRLHWFDPDSGERLTTPSDRLR